MWRARHTGNAVAVGGADGVMADIKTTLKTAVSFLLPLLGLVAAAFIVSRGLAALSVNWPVAAVLVFVATKILTDIVAHLLTRSRDVFYVDEYLKETLIYTLAVLVAIGAIHLARVHIGGDVWVPLLAAVMALTWRHSR